MNCLILSPPSTYRAMILPRLALLSIAAAIRSDHGIRYVDCKDKGFSYQGLAREHAGFPDVIITQSQFTNNVPNVITMRSRLREIFQGVPVIAGGVNAGGDYENLIRSGFDYVCRTEGEKIIQPLLQYLEERDERRCDVPGVAYEHEGQVYSNDPPPLIEELDELPMAAWDLVSEPRYRPTPFGRMALIETSRGCSFKCTYCSPSRQYGSTWRGKSADRVAEEFGIAQRGGATFAWLSEINTSEEPDHVRAFCEALLRSGNRVRWYSQHRADAMVENPDMVSLMHRAGARSVIVGMESASDRSLSKINKELTGDINHRLIDLLKANRIVLNGAFILGIPGETREDMVETIEMAERVDFPDFALLRPYPGTEEAKNFDFTGKYKLFNQGYALLHDDPKMAERMHKLAVFKTWLAPRRLLSVLHPNRHYRALTIWRYRVGFDIVFRKRVKHFLSEKILKHFGSTIESV